MVRTYWSRNLAPWLRYAYGIGALTGLLVPRAARWGRLWLRARIDERTLLARATTATPTTA